MTSASLSSTIAPAREARTLAIISTVHMVSHFYWLMFVPLLPSLRDLLGASYVELGFALFVMNITSAVFQAPIGFLVDRFGPRLFLIVGVIVGAAGFLLLALIPSYWMLLAAVVLVGLGNAVYHPADYSILSAEMSAPRMGRAYAVHTFTGYLGFALTPPIILLMVYEGGPRAALAGGAILGALLCAPLLADLPREQRSLRSLASKPAAAKTSSLSLFTPTVLALTAMFALISLSTNMMQTYMVASLHDLRGLPQGVGETALTLFMFAIVAGVLAGGFLADRVRSKGIITLGGFGCAAMVTLLLGLVPFGAAASVALLSLAGFLAGLIMPSRDMLVRVASPPDAVGRVFGIVATGFNLGGMIGPLIGGALIDHGFPAWIFYGSAVFMAVTVLIAVQVERSTLSAAAP